MVDLIRTDIKKKSPIEAQMETHWQHIRDIEQQLDTAETTDLPHLEKKLEFHQSKLTELEGLLNQC